MEASRLRKIYYSKYRNKAACDAKATKDKSQKLEIGFGHHRSLLDGAEPYNACRTRMREI